MIRFLTVLSSLLILVFLAGGCLGLYYLTDSPAVERGTEKVLDSAAEGMYAVLICTAFGISALGIGFGLRAGAVPTAQAIGHILLVNNQLPKPTTQIRMRETPLLENRVFVGELDLIEK